MKRFLTAVAVCLLLTIALSLLLFPVAGAAENPILALLGFPAPPPANPQATVTPFGPAYGGFDRESRPPDDAPIDELISYWSSYGISITRDWEHRSYPSDKVLDRLIAEIERDPSLTPRLLPALPISSRTVDLVKSIYSRSEQPDDSGPDLRAALKSWLKYNSDQFSSELAREAERVKDTDAGYVNNHRQLVALARVDWDRASSIVSRLYANSGQRASQEAARWALYVHAIKTGSSSDTERYRDELKATAEDKNLSPGVRDLALDALSLEKEWDGRDEWYLSLMKDETLLELGTYTGLTTLITSSPDDKYTDRMISLLESDNINVRTAAARNLMSKTSGDRAKVLRALLPWLANPKWLKPVAPGRVSIVQGLTMEKVPESVPLLISALDERSEIPVYSSNSAVAANVAASAANAAARAAMTAGSRASADNTMNVAAAAAAANAADSIATRDATPLRFAAINALRYQGDPQAVPALRRVFGELEEPYLYMSVVAAIYECGGFSIAEQVNALEQFAKDMDRVVPVATNANVVGDFEYATPARLAYLSRGGFGPNAPDIGAVLGFYLAELKSVRDDLALSVVDRIESLDRNDPATARSLRKIVVKWDSPIVYALLLRDLKNDRSDADAMLRLLSIRQLLREKMSSEISSIRSGGATAYGISACLLEDSRDYESILDGTSDQAKAAMLACARLIRASLSVTKVASNLQSKDKLVAIAAERYLESEDSPEARRIVLSLHPNEAKIMGATTAFFADSGSSPAAADQDALGDLYDSVRLNQSQPGSFAVWARHGASTLPVEKAVRDELQSNPDLLGVYTWQENFIHIYKDRAVLSWRDDPARYRERQLTKEEFDGFKGMLVHHKVDELPPFLECKYCEPREFLMLGKNGGRRVYLVSTRLPHFFADLERTFIDFRRSPAAIKYWAAKSVPGLELVFADDRLHAVAVWKNGADFRLLVTDKERSAEIDREITNTFESTDTEDSDGLAEIDDYDSDDTPIENERARRRYDSFGWFDLRNGAVASPATQPQEAPFIPMKDDLSVPPEETRWKAVAGAVEVRADDNGLYKVVGGKLTKIKSGMYSSPVITPDGRWVVAARYDEEEGSQPVRINLSTGREYAVKIGDDRELFSPIAFVPSVGRMLLGFGWEEVRGEDSNGLLLDVETGKITRAVGEIKPLMQITFRPLQSTGNPFESWAAIPGKESTAVGIYNSRTFRFTPLLSLPDIRFNSMDMWVDAAEGKLYFVYEGHLLSAPLKTGR